jgi:hypothetical protein
MRSLILHCAALLALAVCIAGVHGEAETASKARHNPGHSSQQRNVTLQLVGYTAKGTVPAGAEQVNHPDSLSHRGSRFWRSARIFEHDQQRRSESRSHAMYFLEAVVM